MKLAIYFLIFFVFAMVSAAPSAASTPSAGKFTQNSVFIPVESMNSEGNFQNLEIDCHFCCKDGGCGVCCDF